MQWPAASTGSQIGTQPPQSYPTYGTSPPQNFCPQPYSATYSFAADFRPETSLDSFRPQWIPPPSSLITTGSGISSNSRSYTSSKRQKSASKL